VSPVEANIETKRAIKNSEDTIPNDFFRKKNEKVFETFPKFFSKFFEIRDFQMTGNDPI
jgi:hypothetical protein